MSVKSTGQVFTPLWIVQLMLDKLKFTDDAVLSNKIMEPSFGEGVFLLEIVNRIIVEGNKKHLENNDILAIIKNNVFGIELDENLYNKTLYCLNRLLYDCGLTDSFDWSNNLFCENTLKTDFKDFDIVVGNPPYVNIHNIKEKDIVQSMEFSKEGMTDLYIAFFEKGLNMLKDTGKLCYITPNSYFNSKAGRVMRKHIIDNKYLVDIVDFGHEQIFDGYTTYSCITLLDKNNTQDICKYKIENSVNEIKYKDLFVNENFYFCTTTPIKQILSYNKQGFCKVKNGFATLCDKFFINNDNMKNSQYLIPVKKSSTNIDAFCFYPYDENGKIIDFETIKQKEPLLAEYLLENKAMLKSRSIEKEENWYGFGRNQAISDTYKDKITINAILKSIEDVKLSFCKSGCGVYGGLYILTNVSIKEIEKILYSDDFILYVKALYRYKNGGYYTFTSKELEKYLNYKLWEDKNG